MIDVISSALVIAMAVNFIMLLPWYNKLKEKGKPFSCSFCMGWWVALAIGVFNLHSLAIIEMLFVALSAPFLSVLFERLLASLPIKL
ncbi:hypothetical protein [Sphingobacterium mizutaii]|uniref:hypothetical protein n=1 Tax=Sphingobacterium mizutaii TaxID=1010 RepID=UPI0016276990|nr:hypothetical protein [Sphingobacterium mizutaii]